MNTPNKLLMQQAREMLKGKWVLGIKVTIVYGLISMLLQAIPTFGPIASLIASGPLTFGVAIFWLAFSRNQNPELGKMFEGFNTWIRALKAYFLMIIYIFLRLLLLIVPGIIAVYAYSQTYYILADDKEIGVNDAIKKSKEMMKGHKWKLFCLGCRFIGWGLLCILTLGIGFLWLIPYAQTSSAKFYDDIKGNNPTETPVVPELVAVPVAA